MNREELNNYYSKLNALVDEYVDKWKIRPTQLKRYLKPGSKNFNRFLERNGLSDISLVKQVLIDVLEDRYAEEIDGVIKFEKFNLFESDSYVIDDKKECLYKGVEKATISYEKALSDHFDVNLGSINVKDSEKHIFEIEEWVGKPKSVIIYSSLDMEIIKANLVQYFKNKISKEKVKLLDDISITLSKITEQEKIDDLLENSLTEDKIIDSITDCIKEFKFKSKFQHSGLQYYVWYK